MGSTRTQNIAVTGGLGFIGSHLIRHLIQHHPSALIYNIDKGSYAANEANVADVADAPNYQNVRLDLCDQGAVVDFFAQHTLDVVFHLAAETHVDRSIANATLVVQNNVLATQNLLEALRNHWQPPHPTPRRLIHVSTDEVFGALSNQGAFTINSPYAPSSPYAASKAAADHLVAAYGHTYGLPHNIVHPSNNYGTHQYPEKLIPLAITSLLERKPIGIYGAGNQVRDWLHVSDHVRGLMQVWQQGQPHQSFALGGTAEEWTNLQVVTYLAQTIAKAQHANEAELLACIQQAPDRLGHDFRYRIDNTHAEQVLGYAPSVNLKKGLEDTVQWYL